MTRTLQLKHISTLELLRIIRDRDEAIRSLPRWSPADVPPTPDVALADRFPAKLVLAKMAKLDDRGWLEWGVSLRTAWLSEKGEEVLAEMEAKEAAKPSPAPAP